MLRVGKETSLKNENTQFKNDLVFYPACAVDVGKYI